MLKLVRGFSYRPLESGRQSTDLYGRADSRWDNGEPPIMRGSIEFDFDKGDIGQLENLFRLFGHKFPPDA